MNTHTTPPTDRDKAAVRRLIWEARLTAAMYALWRHDMLEIEYVEQFGEEPCSE